MTTQHWSRLRVLSHLVLVALATAPAVRAATIPTGFSEKVIASGLSSPTAMQLAPDGRLFVCEQAGRLRVIKDGTLLTTPFLTVTVSAVGERGLLGVAFDPAFATNHFVYVITPPPRRPSTIASVGSPPMETWQLPAAKS
jgi:glucose/arabinose dehydrogenase